MIKRIFSLFDARNKEFYRDTSSMAWNFLFPIVVVFGFAFAFSGENQNIFKVAVHRDSAVAATSLAKDPEFLGVKYIQFIPAEDLPGMVGKLERHQVDMVVALGSPLKYWINSSSPKGYLLERILRGTESGGPHAEKQIVEGKEIRYVDWLISGLLAMNMAFSALFGVGYTIVRYRKNGVLKRLKATPIHAYEFLTAQVISRLILILVTSSLVYFGCTAVIHFRMLGSYFDLFVVMTAGAMCLISLGLLIAARIKSEEFAGGVLNLITWPMMFLSGVWFSLEGAHPWVLRIAQIFPLTHLIDASRAIMTEGANLSQVSYHLGALLLMTLVFMVIGSVSFKWE